MVKIDEQLDVEPARFFVHSHIHPSIHLPWLRDGGDGGKAAPGLLAWLSVSKFAD